MKRVLGIGVWAFLLCVAVGMLISPVAAAQKVDEVKVGVVLPLSGNIAQTGNLIKAAMELSQEVINNSYPDLKVPMATSSGFPNFDGAKLKIVFLDTQNIPEKGMSATEQLITREKVCAVMGAYSSAVTATAAQAAERLGVPFLNENSTSPKLTQRGFKWFYRCTPDDDLFTKNFFEFMRDVENIKGIKLGKTIAMMYENTLWGADVAVAIRKYAPQFGYQIITDIPYTSRAASLTSEVQQLKRANADVVMLASYVSDAILIQRTFKDLNYIPPVILAQNSGHNDPNFVGTVGSLADYLVSREVYTNDGRVNPSIPTINEMFKAKTGFNLDGNSARGFMGMLILADAISRAKSLEPEDVRIALHETNIPKELVIFPWDGVKFDPETHQISTGRGIIVQIQDQKYVAIWPFDIASSEVSLPIPSWEERGL